GFEETLRTKLLEQVPEQNDMVLRLIDMAQQMLDSAKGGVVAGFGLIVLFWSVLKVISNIEESFNQIWKVKKARSIGRKLSDYLSLMLLAPLLFILAGSIDVYVQTQLTSLINAIALPGTFFFLQLLNYLSIFIYWSLFSFVFIFMPNIKVNYLSGIFAGVIAGTIYQGLLTLYVSLQIGVSSYNAIYGSFAALPLFLIWLQITWFIVLFGSELSYFYQNIELYQFNQKFKTLNYASKIELSQLIMQTIISRFSEPDKPAYSAKQLSQQLELPITIAYNLLATLEAAQLLTVIDSDSLKEESYQPRCDVRLLSNEYIEQVLKHHGEAYHSPAHTV
ncbi:MAG: YihY family inner membrane protein, partial [Methyloprofundus sp.]|nr:YihY family inner membrane protein [Methyloprofundus sp.]